jgi:leucyl-tRNA synthetase
MSTTHHSDNSGQLLHISQIHPPKYDFVTFESKWRTFWEEHKLYQVDLHNAPNPYYNLMMFPYPSAEGLHVGNMYAFVGSDIQGRWKAMQGYDVFEPIGLDAFGIHSENFAIKKGIHPHILTAQNAERFRERQLKRIGNRFDWSHELNSTDPHYYRWTQWIFIQLFKAGLAERKAAPVNWCPKDKTVLADEQVINGHCERCGSLVQRRLLEQWFLKITSYAQRMLDDMDQLDWSERVKTIQRNWIGRSQGLEFKMAIDGHSGLSVQVYTTRPDTIFGMTFVALAPQHPLIPLITDEPYQEAVAAYQASTSSRSIGESHSMSGVFTGAHAIHPLTGERIPIWIADFVLDEYGSGAVMGVPAHDETDLMFAQAMGLPVRVVVQPMHTDTSLSHLHDQTGAFEQPGLLINSGAYSGMTTEQASTAISEWFEAKDFGKRSIQFRLRDWLISRQRYWGPPIPIIYCPDHGAVPVPEDQLPVLLPDTDNWMPTGTGVSPLAAIDSFVNTTCPICGKPARRETDVSDNFLDSAWYFLRYPSNNDETQPWDPDLTCKWLPVDMYIGGAEHSVLHLMYARFIIMALHDLGHLEFAEPFKRFRANGTITKGGAKISKSKGNVVNPDEYIDRFGTDAFRLHLMFMLPYEAGGDFNDVGISGIVRFLNRIWQFVSQRGINATTNLPTGEAKRVQHQTIKRVTEFIATLKYNTAIAAMMEYLNALEAAANNSRAELETLLQLLAPFAPFITEELWHHLGHQQSIHTSSWPTFNPDAITPASITIPVQVNGRVRDNIIIASNTSEEEIKQLALSSGAVQRFIANKNILKIIYVPGRIINIVTST